MKMNTEYTNHPVWDYLAELEKAIDNHSVGRGALDIAIRTKTKAALKYFDSFKSKHLLAPLSWPNRLDSLVVEIRQIHNQYANWAEGGITSASFASIEASIDRGIQFFQEWPIQVNSKSEKTLNDARLILEEIAAYRDEQANSYQRTETQIDALQTDLKNAISQWNIERDALTNLRSELKVSTTEIALETKKELSDEAAETKKQFLGIYESTIAEAQELKGRIFSLVEEAENLASVKAGQVISEGYEKYALQLEDTRELWHKRGFVVLSIGVPVILVFYFFGGALDLGLQYLVKASITLTMGAIVAYSFREAGQAGKAAELARYRHLDSVALSTYIRGLKSDETVISIQEQLGRRLASERVAVDTGESKSLAKVVNQLLRSLEKVVSRATR